MLDRGELAFAALLLVVGLQHLVVREVLVLGCRRGGHRVEHIEGNLLALGVRRDFELASRGFSLRIQTLLLLAASDCSRARCYGGFHLAFKHFALLLDDLNLHVKLSLQLLNLIVLLLQFVQAACELILQYLLFILHFNLKVGFVTQSQVKSVLEVFELEFEPLFSLNSGSRIRFQMAHLLLVLVVRQGD